MSRQELIRLYSEGLLARRDFVRRLTLAGVSAGAAAAYAQSLAPSASAAAVRPLAIQQAEYGGPINPDDLQEAVEALIELLDAIIDFLRTSLDLLGPDAFLDFLVRLGESVDVFGLLQTLLSQLGAEQDTLRSATAAVLSPDVAKRRLLVSTRLLQDADVDTFISDLGDVLDIQCQLYAGLIPAAKDAELRGELASLAIVKGEQAAFVRILRGLSPFPNELETPIDAADAREQIEAILD